MPVITRDVKSLSKSGEAKLKGDVTLSEGANITLTQVGNDVEVASTAGSGATTALDNLASVAINATLVSDTDNTDALGTTAIAWSDLFLGSGAVITFNSASSTADITITHALDILTFAGGTIALGTATATGGLTGNVTGNVSGTADTVTNATQAAITTLANLTSIQNQTISLSGSLTVELASVLNQDLTTDAEPTFATLTLSNGLTLDGGGIATPTSITLSNAGTTINAKSTLDAASVSIAVFEGDRATMADNDEAYIRLRLSNDAGTQTEFARIIWVATDVNAGTGVDGRLDFAVVTAGSLADELQLDGTALSPSTTDGLSLGTTLLNYSDLFLDSGAVIDFDSGDVVLTHSANLLTLAGGSLNLDSLTASEIVITDASKNLVSAAVATYPSLTELSYIKGVSSAIQTQIDGKSPTAGNASLVTVGTITTGVWNGTDIAVADGGTGGGVAGITLFNNITGYTAAGATGTTSTNLVFSTSPTLVTPLLGTPTSGTLTNCTGLPLTGLVSDTTTALGIGSINLGHATDTTLARVSAGVVSIEGVNILTTAGGTLTGNITLGEGADPATIGIVIDASMSADERYSGITVPGTAGATLAFGDLCYLDVTAGEWLLADASVVGTGGNVVLGICVDASTDGAATSMLLIGTVRSAAFPASVALGAPLYLSETAGDITATAPVTADSVMRRVGWAVTVEPNTIYFNPSNDYVTHT